MTPQRETLEQAFLSFWNTWAERSQGENSLDLITHYFDSSVTAIGTGEHEKGRNYEEVLLNFKADFAELPKGFDIDFFRVQSRMVSNSIGVVEAESVLEIIPEEETKPVIFHLRFSTIFKDCADGWKILHNHVSIPADSQNIGEAYPIDALKAKNDRLQKLVDERTLELVQKSKLLESEKERTEQLLLNILPAEIAEELKLHGRSEAKHHDQVSILFTDFAEFTRLSQKLTAVELVAEINECFKSFDNICDKYSVEKIKTIGDSYMAAGGMLGAEKDAAANTVLAALEMNDFVLKRFAHRKAAGFDAFQMRSGVHTGPVVAGIVGVKKFQYDVWGDTVNTASRMELHGENGRVNVSQSTYDLLKEDPRFHCFSRGKVQVKGKGSIPMYFVEKIK